MKTSILVLPLTVILLSGTVGAMEISPACNLSVPLEIGKNFLKCISTISLPEGLTPYLIDYLYEEQKGRGWEYRKNLVVEYENCANPGKEIPLKDSTRVNKGSHKAICYGKGVMFFHMLKNLVGKEAFNNALKGLIQGNNAKEPSWDDLKIAFEKSSGKDLEWFFRQWLDRKGIPSIEIKNSRVDVLNGIRKVSFDVVQKSEAFRFNLPVKINTDKGEVKEILNIEKQKETFEFPVPGNPLEITADGDYDLLRKLSDDEYPPVVSRLLGDENRLLIVPKEGREKYSELIDDLRGKSFVLKEESEIKDEDIKKNSLLILGFEGPVLKRLFGGVRKPDSGFTLTVMKNPLNISKVVAVACGDSKDEISPVIKELSRYGSYSYIRFEKGQIIKEKIAETERGIRVPLDEPVVGIQPQKAMKLDEIIQKILDKPVIYVGERHVNFEDHRIQLKIIMGLHEGGRRFAIGMEMFQKPFQKAIDDYLEGAISEKEFLKKTQYFKEWQLDYNLYREIIEYAKSKNIPIIALNIRSEIVKTVAKDGLDALTETERAEIPEDMDMADRVYRQRLTEIFETHKNFESKSFGNFYQAQIIWDETMAHSIDAFFKKNPDYQMVVLAGAGHIMYGSGIPKRAFRLTGKDYTTLLSGSGRSVDDSADFILFPEHIPQPDTVKLGVVLKEADGKVKIEKVLPLSVAEKADLKKDDVILSIDNWVIEGVNDVKIYLFDKKKGERIKIKVLRKKFLAGYKEIEFTAAL